MTAPANASDAYKDQIRAISGQYSVFNVKEDPYNATGDGSTDDTAAIQAALDAARTAGGGTVYVPEGTYIISLTAGSYGLWLPSNTRLTGDGFSSILKIASGDTDNFSIIENDPDEDGAGTGISNSEISYLAFDGNKSRVAVATWGVLENEGIDLKTPENVYINHCYVHDCGTDGIDLDEPTFCTISECLLEDNGGCGVHFTGATSVNHHCIISNITGKGNSYYRLQSTDAAVREAAGLIGIGGAYHLINGVVSLNDERGITLTGTTRCTIDGAVISQPGAGTVPASVITANEDDPVRIDYSSNNTPSGGGVAQGGGCGVYVSNGGVQNIVGNVSIDMRGNKVDSYGVLISNNLTVRTQISNVNCSSGQYGLYLNGPGDTNVAACVFANTNGGKHAVIVSANDSGSVIVLNGVYAHNGGGGGFRVLNDASNVSFIGCTAVNSPAGDGFNVLGGSPAQDNIAFIGCVATGNADDGIDIQADAGTPTGCSIINCNVQGNTGSAIENDASDTVITGNIGWTTEAKGSASIATGATIAHGCDSTPTSINVTPAVTGLSDIYATVDGTNITVNFTGGGTNLFFWEASV